MLFQSCQEGGVRLPVQRADQLRDAQEEADPLRDEHAHSRPLSAAERPRHQEVLHKNIKRYAYCFSISLSHYFFPSTTILSVIRLVKTLKVELIIITRTCYFDIPFKVVNGQLVYWFIGLSARSNRIYYK